MTHRILLLMILSFFSFTIHGQNNIPDRLVSMFQNQLEVFPQEKIYLHTDKPYYISGEKIWFRAYLADAKSHEPVAVSRYVYVELINPLDTVVTRVKIRQEKGAYHGYLSIPEDAPEGDYTMRAYTAFMRSQDENYFCTKTVRLGDPQARAIHTETQFTFDSDSKVYATFRFSRVGTTNPHIPQSVKVSINEGKPMNIKVDNDGTAGINFNLPTTSQKRIILLEIADSGNPYRQFIHIPTPDNDFDISFYPEGGSLMQGTFCKVAFKAMKSNGQSADISGTVYDQTGKEIKEFHSDYLGMGSFPLLAEKGKTYYAICQNDKGEAKRFDLPVAVDYGYALAINGMKDKMYVSVLKPLETTQNDELYLLAHTRGRVHFADRWDNDKYFIIQPEQFPSGVLHLILFDAGMNPVSERLVFINNPDQAQVSYQPDQAHYAVRSLVKNKVTLANSEGQPLTGSFSVAVTSDKEVQPDSMSNILTQLLLISDLRGNIENPAYYFQNTTASALALDLLMCTQGWRRYNIAELAHENFTRPTSTIEIIPEISGVVKNDLLGTPAKNMEVTIMSLKNDYFDKTKTDKDGRFSFRGVEWPDSTSFTVSVKMTKTTTAKNLILDKENFPERTLSAALPVTIDRHQFAQYADKAEQQYVYENGVRMIHLPEVNISAQRKPLGKSAYYDFPSYTITRDDLIKFSWPNIFYYLNTIPGVYVNFNSKTVEFAHHLKLDPKVSPVLIVDDTLWDIEDIDAITTCDIAQIDILSGAISSAFGVRAYGGAIVIFTMRGKDYNDNSKPLHIKDILPLGYQQPIEFYAPKYDTSAKRNEQFPDLRTTIHWQPVVQTDSEGEASFEFYTADEPTSYTVIIEGLADDGSIIRKEGKLWIKDK